MGNLINKNLDENLDMFGQGAVALAGLRGVTIALRERSCLNSVLSVDNYVIFTCCARGGNKINAMLHEFRRVFARASLVLLSRYHRE